MELIQPLELMIICRLMRFLCHITGKKEGTFEEKKKKKRKDKPLHKNTVFLSGSPLKIISLIYLMISEIDTLIKFR